MVNKKYYYLDDMVWLFEQLKTKSMKQLARELSQRYGDPIGILAGCIRFRVHRYFTKDQKDQIRRQRAFHKNKTAQSLPVSPTGESVGIGGEYL